MKTFAYIVTPVTIKELKNYWPELRILPDFLIKTFIKSLPAIKTINIKKIKSTRGKEIEGYLIISHLLGQNLSDSLIIDKIISAGKVAQRLGAKIIGLGGYAAKSADNAPLKTFKDLKLPITTGSALTAWSVIEQIYRIAKIKKIDLKQSTISILNASNPTGSLCSKRLSDYANRIIITDNDPDKLIKLKEVISYLNPTIEVQIEDDVERAIRKANIVVNTGGSALNTERLKSDTILSNLSLNGKAIDKSKLRSDITFVEAGLVKLPYSEKLYNDFGLEKGVVSASMAETMLLALQEKFVTYSLGDRINLDKLEEIADTAVQHGFEIWAPEAPVI